MWTTAGIAALSFAAGFGLGRATGDGRHDTFTGGPIDGPTGTSAVPFTVAPAARSGNSASSANDRPPSAVATTSLAVSADASVVLEPIASAADVAHRPPPLAPTTERALVDSAHNALARGRPSDALLLTEQDGNLFPNGELAEERDFMRVTALRDLGRIDEAASRGKAFVTLYPNSAYRRSVQAFLASAPTPPSPPTTIIVAAPKPPDPVTPPP
ncbi:MAG: hypothetical protein ABI461_11430, partial [Polyangiaceae bacterium]